MSIDTRIKSLVIKHDEIDLKLHDAYFHHLPTAELKKQKLHIKDSILRLQHRPAA